MDRRTFNKLAGLTALSTLANLDLRAQQPPDSQEVVLQDNALLVSFDKKSGALKRLLRKSSGWTVQRRPELGMSFRLLVPLPHQRANFILGEKQRAASVEQVSDHQVRLQWKDLLSEHGGVLPITFTATVTLQDGALTFDGTLTNNSDLTVETIDYPYLGDLSAPTRNTPLSTGHIWYANLAGEELYPVFHNEKGGWGVDFPTKTIESKETLFALIQSPSEGLYVGMHDPTQPYLLEWTFEQHPGVLTSIGDPVPQEDTLSGLPAFLQFRTCHFVFVHPHSAKTLAPVVVRGYDGGWHGGLDVYKQWRSTWFKQPRIAAWALNLHSWLQLQIDGAEQDYTIPYRELPKYIDECAANGVTAIQLVGWELGGQDGGDPSMSTDPGLGTWEELHQAILYGRSKGVKMILFGKPIWAEITTEWTKKELYRYAATDPYGSPYVTGGYSYTTPTQLAGINNRRRYVMDVQCQAYRDIATREFQKTVDLGAAGWLFDEVCTHNFVAYSFSEGRGYQPPGYLFGGDMPMAKQFRDAADKTDPDFLFAGEAPQDWLLQCYPFSYFRIDADCRAVCRYIDPQAPLLVAVTGFDDREMLNLILLNRYLISYEPYIFKGHVTDFPLTLAYGKKIDALRGKYREYLWDAEFHDTLGAKVTSTDGSPRHSVFVTRSGKRAVVVVNLERNKAIGVTVDLPKSGKLTVVTPDEPEQRPTTGTLQVPARSAVVVLEV